MAQAVFQVSASNRDAFQFLDGSGFAVAGTTLTCDRDLGGAGAERNGLIFTLLNIPQGADILAVDISIYIVSSNDDRVDSMKVYCEAVDDAADFTANADIVARTWTTAFGQMDDATISGATGFHALKADWTSGVDLISMVQEVINRPGWAPGNKLMVIFSARTAPGAGITLLYNTWDFSGNVRGAKLDITWAKNAVRNYARVMA